MCVTFTYSVIKMLAVSMLTSFVVITGCESSRLSYIFIYAYTIYDSVQM